MAISTGRKSVLDWLKTLLEGITVANGYQTNVREVRRGIHDLDDMPNRPALCIWNDKGPAEELVKGAAGVNNRTLHCWIWGYVDVDPGDYDNLDALVADVEQRINTSDGAWPSNMLNITIMDSTYYEGGVSDAVGIFEMEIELVYRYDRNNV